MRVTVGNGKREAGNAPTYSPLPYRQLPVLDQRLRGTKFVELSVRSIVNSPESTKMGFWSVNPYVGCEFGCSYCYARYAHRYVVERANDAGRLTSAEFNDLNAPAGLEPFEHRIFVKSRNSVLAALDRGLARVRKRALQQGPQTLLIGTGTDPYQPAERRYRVTRAILERLRLERGLLVGIITKSPLVCRDIDLLVAVAGKDELSVYISLTTVDVRFINLFEARSPMPHARLRALEKLSASGIRAGLIVAPVLPGITDSVPQVEAVVKAAAEAGAHFIRPVPLRLYPDVRNRFLPLIERHFPDLAARYRARYERAQHAPQSYIRALKRRFKKIAERYGITDCAGSEAKEPPHRVEREVAQLELLQTDDSIASESRHHG
ncbi:MAG: radical SAM protein [Gemmatimonadales bacterium]